MRFPTTWLIVALACTFTSAAGSPLLPHCEQNDVGIIVCDGGPPIPRSGPCLPNEGGVIICDPERPIPAESSVEVDRVRWVQE
ncbi:hypothetical protein EXIGLDRAFT_737555 [Exidia glandulosa HHB12029]|uniref:CBM1 domain-containing protein n=1 Tax=Exidia glandulosa HHB12029 TaxID=1314781 RepID=A0A165IWF9_EXIGL|nr:hypothetical protein EXIGLDRAFT_737555 [Exidia glandulosa HHB12029]